MGYSALLVHCPRGYDIIEIESPLDEHAQFHFPWFTQRSSSFGDFKRRFHVLARLSRL